MHWLLTQRAHAPVKVSLFSIAFGREIESAARSTFQKCHRTCAPCIASCAAPCRDRDSPVAHAKRARAAAEMHGTADGGQDGDDGSVLSTRLWVGDMILAEVANPSKYFSMWRY